MQLIPPDMICFALYSAQHAMQQAYAELLDGLGLTYPQYLLMTALWAEDGRTVGALGRDLRLESNTLTPMLKRLEGQGLVRRKRDSKDERRVLIRVTAKGRALQEQAARIPECLIERVGLPLEDLTRLRDELHDLRDRLRSAGEEG
ncbi:MarR family winged helix-turn-helix transcriptional regulator [Salipiger bermudensis]|uniref:Probable transcriptional regulator protein, MarR family n=1 Tax=Salipiger bermudensis (strain DSM 26914 / JCM 13377 / KCTC 12554 / HTCC2601) TaxID=314265 RepID=Q0FL17_SALBH|nr:MarR family transcriptional regulator [Salipiger bermudensis]MAE89951.1 MarR family transcriptional regulator [Pelagibaca sp.]MBR9891056.1 MarR family transcriptional regulator [bacterium]EAU44843.1 probable transcriptional regulator protein, MarR family [Salipiger bermudensis HTCC2601]MBN9676601.1 MarR family transcriptional regulator [Salipiger bermudensis]MCA1287283.1 MarR family transcriptional regulator [Salipiger bermudensis]